MVGKYLHYVKDVSFCHYCLENKNAHSFNTIKGNFIPIIQVYDTVIKDAELYNDPESIIYHIEECLKSSLSETTSSWFWVINFYGASTKHYLALSTVYQLCCWINKEKDGLCKNLESIYVLNGNKLLLLPLIQLAKLFLPSHINIDTKI